MVRGSRLVWMMIVAFAGCSGDGGAIGDSCGGNRDCDGTLQCLNSRCVPRCLRAPECGDGYSCDEHGSCLPATGPDGSHCLSEVDCAAGLACQIDSAALDSHNRPLSRCRPEISASPAGATCNVNSECRNGTCALGHCIDLCSQTRDCSVGNSCAIIPSALANNAQFWGCLPATGRVTWSIPVTSPSAEILLPVPNIARSAELVMSVDDLSQKVGASSILSPAGVRVYSMPCSPLSTRDPTCDRVQSLDQYFANQVRHQPAFGQSVLAIPSGTFPTGTPAFQPGVYRVAVSSFRANDLPGSAIPHVTAVVQLSPGRILDLHFFFLDLADHPCAAMTNNAALDASAAQAATFFQEDYLGELGTVFDAADVMLGTTSYEDITGHPELDGLDIADAGSLFRLGKPATGINVFFVRSLSPIGLAAFGPNPGPAGLGSTTQSGIVIALDTLCYRSWTSLARLTAHELARYMGLYHNVELETAQHPTWRDAIFDSDDSSTNLMFFSESSVIGTEPSLGTELSNGQREILLRSAVLR
jgi:hypothetical protein